MRIPLWLVLVSVALVLAFATPPAALRAEDDSLEGPWGTVHADLSGTSSSAQIPYTLGSGPVEKKWTLDVVALGQDRPGGLSSLAFDSSGNIYWLSSTGGGTAGVVRILSASTDGNLRWFGNDGTATPALDPLGSTFSGASPVVGQARVYGLGDAALSLWVKAYKKDTGALIWTAELSPSTVGNNSMLTPVLYKGDLYVVGLANGLSQDVYRVDAQTGDVDWQSNVPEVKIAAHGQMAFIPDAFGAGVHGLYFNGSSGSDTDGTPDVYGIKIEDTGASIGWTSEGGHVARSHVIYSNTTKLLYTLTWGNSGFDFYVFDPVTGFKGKYANSRNSGHGFYDVGALEFEGSTIIAGGFEGLIFRYKDSGGGAITDQIIFKGGTSLNIGYWAETRLFGQLVKDPSGNNILITATNSSPCCSSKVVAIDVTNRKLLWEFDTETSWPSQYQYAGGPLMGPDGKVYFFPRIVGNLTPGLVAIGPAATDPLPRAYFLVADAAGNYSYGCASYELNCPGTPPDPVTGTFCAKAGDVVRLDGGCSIGKDLTYKFVADPPDGVTVTQASPTDPLAEMVFANSGQYDLALTVTNTLGTDERNRTDCYTWQFCVVTTAPVCALDVTDSGGNPIDDAEDADTVSCLVAGGTAIADAGKSTGGDLEYTFGVDPMDGVTITQAGGISNPKASIVFAKVGTYVISVTTSNDKGESTGPCATTICVMCERPDSVSISGATDGEADSPVTLTAAMTGVDQGATASYSWEITAGTGGSLDTPTGRVVNLTATEPGALTVKVTANDGLCDNVVTASHTVTFSCSEQADGVSISGATEGEAGSPVTLTAAMTGVDPSATASYSWAVITVGNGSLDTTSGPVVNLTAANPGAVTVKVTANDGRCGNIVTAEHTVNFAQAGVGPFIRGDCNGDGQVTGQVTDAVFLLNYNFLGGEVPPCSAACDINSDGAWTGQVTDAVYLLNYNFLGGPAPLAPFPGCGKSTRAEDKDLGCARPTPALDCP